MYIFLSNFCLETGLKVIKLKFIINFKIKCNDWLLWTRVRKQPIVALYFLIVSGEERRFLNPIGMSLLIFYIECPHLRRDSNIPLCTGIMPVSKGVF